MTPIRRGFWPEGLSVGFGTDSALTPMMQDNKKYPELEIICPEDVFRPVLEGAIRTLVGTDAILVPDFGLDVALLLQKPGDARARFIEVKACQGYRTLLTPIGGPRGTGQQINLLLLEEPHLSRLDTWVRWVLAFKCDRKGQSLKPGTSRYALFTCREAKAAAQNGVQRGKQNNLMTPLLAEHLITWDQLLDELGRFILG